ncbi:MAG: PilW family protein [Acidobacteriota bacterium]
MEKNRIRGFTLVEMVVGLAVSLVVVGGAVTLLRQSVTVNEQITQRAEMQQNARVALNQMARDLSIAGTGTPVGGIQLPDGGVSSASKFACDSLGCYLADNTYGDQRLYAVTPGDGRGPTAQGIATDVVTLMYRDLTLPLDDYALLSVAADQIQVNPATTPPITDPAVGIRNGDVLALCNVNGCAAGAVTSSTSDRIYFSDGDPLNLNQTSAGFGNISSLANPDGTYPQTTAFRINVLTYYVDAMTSRMMRQLSAHAPAPVAENIVDLQLTYDIYDDGAAVGTAELPNAGGTPNQVRKINISVGARSPARSLLQTDYERINLTTSVSARNLAFRDRYN